VAGTLSMYIFVVDKDGTDAVLVFAP